MTWDEVLGPLTMQPRENGTAAVHETTAWLADTLAGTGAEVVRVSYTLLPYGMRIAGACALIGSLAYAWLLWRRRYGAALALATPLYWALLFEFGLDVRLFGWLGGTATQEHVVARLAATAPRQRLILSAHFDSITQAVDHVASARLDLLHAPAAMIGCGVATALFMRARAGRLRRAWRIVAAVAALVAVADGIGFFVEATAGGLMRRRSHGAIDDGAAAAILVRAAEALGRAPRLAHTDVEVVLFSGEEEMVQGSHAYVRERFGRPPDLPTAVVNFEFLGLGPNLALVGREPVGFRTYHPDPAVIAMVDSAHRAARGRPIPVALHGGFSSTDARSFLRAGIPAATVVSYDEPRSPPGIHTAWDDRTHVAGDAVLDDTLAFVLRVVEAAERRGAEPPAS